MYALGLILREALVGSSPRAVRAEAPRAVPGVDPGLTAIVAKCLAPDPADRYSDAAALTPIDTN